jgi:hypothetical protein
MSVIGPTNKYTCEVTLVTAHGQPTFTGVGFHDELMAALRAHFNKPTTPHYVAEVTVTHCEQVE